MSSNNAPTLPTSLTSIIPSDDWQMIDFVADFHLNPAHPKTVVAWADYLINTQADTVFLLGDIFEAWIGDDAALDCNDPFFNSLINTIQQATKKKTIYYMHGNRDFLVGKRFIDACQLNFLDDPCILELNQQRWLLSHGDALCTDDLKYMKFRQQVRSANWQKKMLHLPLFIRKLIAKLLRYKSKSNQKNNSFTDLNYNAVQQWLQQTNCQFLLHGHTHHPDEHSLDQNLLRIVLSDWEFDEDTDRAEIFRFTRTKTSDWQWQRLPANQR